MRFFTFLAGFIFLLGLAAPAMAQDSAPPATGPASTASASAGGDFYKNGLQMGTALCGNPGSYSCDNVALNSDALIQAANQCAATYQSINEKIMTEFRNSGEYENCILPSKMYTDVNGINSWAICCVRRMESGQECSLICTRFIANKSR
jgi:hypothetical protein